MSWSATDTGSGPIAIGASHRLHARVPAPSRLERAVCRLCSWTNSPRVVTDESIRRNRSLPDIKPMQTSLGPPQHESATTSGRRRGCLGPRSSSACAARKRAPGPVDPDRQRQADQFIGHVVLALGGVGLALDPFGDLDPDPSHVAVHSTTRICGKARAVAALKAGRPGRRPRGSSRIAGANRSRALDQHLLARVVREGLLVDGGRLF